MVSSLRRTNEEGSVRNTLPPIALAAQPHVAILAGNRRSSSGRKLDQEKQSDPEIWHVTEARLLAAIIRQGIADARPSNTDLRLPRFSPLRLRASAVRPLFFKGQRIGTAEARRRGEATRIVTSFVDYARGVQVT